MKPQNIIGLFLLLAVVVSCGSADTESLEAIAAAGDLNAVRAKKGELVTQQRQLEGEIAYLDSVIAANTEKGNLPLVTTLEAKEEHFDHFVEFQGGVTTKQNVLIYPEVSGTLIEMKVREGDRVQKGQVLAVIDDGGMASQLEQLKAQLSLAETTYKRQKNLWERNIGTEIQYLQAKTSYESQSSAVTQFEEQIAKFTVTAPFTGIIDEVIKDLGTVVAPVGQGSEMFRIVNLSKMYVEVSVPENYLKTVVPGKDVKVFFPVLNETIETKVRETGNFINPNNRSFTAEIPVPNQNGLVKPNLTAKVNINDYTNEKAILLPLSVLSENAEGQQYVYVASKAGNGETMAYKKVVETGKAQGDFIEITSGITSGDDVIIEGARSVKDGQEVKILTQKS